ncbi:MAG: hypothetical protein AAB227_01085 [Pseudomonadota bacterium]
MRFKYFSARDAAKNFGALMEAAEVEPVMIRRHSRPRAAVLGWRLFEDYKKAYDEAFDARQVRLLELRMQALIEGKLGTDHRIRALGERMKKGLVSLDKVPMEDEAPER